MNLQSWKLFIIIKNKCYQFQIREWNIHTSTIHKFIINTLQILNAVRVGNY